MNNLASARKHPKQLTWWQIICGRKIPVPEAAAVGGKPFNELTPDWQKHTKSILWQAYEEQEQGTVSGWIKRRIIRKAIYRLQDEIIGTSDDPYLVRWYLLPKNKWLNAYVHIFLRPDDDRELHDHPWPSMSLILWGQYEEILTGDVSAVRKKGDISARKATDSHRIALIDNAPCVTLFMIGPKVREWGFTCPNGWKHWSDFLDPANPGRPGPGCE